MPIYEFGCPEGHVFDVRLPITSEENSAPCPQCHTTARRLVSLPAFHGGSASARRLIESTQATAYQPGVVSSLPSGRSGGDRRAAPVTRDPRHAKLPRP